MNATLRKIAAVAEVCLVTFVFVPYLTRVVNLLFPWFNRWQTEMIGFDFPVFVYVVMVALSLLAIFLRGGKPADYGIHFRDLKYQLGIAAACFFPVALSYMPLAMGFDETTWSGAIVMAASKVALLLVLALILRKKIPVPALAPAAACVLLWPAGSSSSAQVAAGKGIAIFLTYALFVGFGEEILFRGYMHSRLSEAFGKPYRFFQTHFGWGAIITALLFGLMHVGILRWIINANIQVTLAWGFWTVFAGLVSGFVREKSGGILAPALLHGLPQAMAFTAMFFRV